MIRNCFLIVALLCSVVSANAQSPFSLPDHFRTERALPLLDFATDLDVKLSDFGAIPDDGKDDTQKIIKALNFCKKITSAGSTVKLVFEKGTYDLFSTTIKNKNKTHILSLNQAKNIIVDGNGSDIIVHDPGMGFFSIFKSENVIVKNLVIDYDPLPFTQGTIVNVNMDDRYFELKIDEGFPQLSHPMFQEANRVWGMVMDKEIPGKLKDGARSLFGSQDFEEIAPNLFKVKFKGKKLLEDLEVGDPYVHLARTNGRTIFKTSLSKNITYLSNTSYTSPAGSYAAGNMEEWSVINCRVLMKEGRIHSANADCFHINGGKFGPWIENSLFEGYSDDAVNFKSSKRQILKQLSPTELIVKFHVEKDDIIRIYNPRDGIYIGAFTVVDNKFQGDNKMKITLDKPIDIELNTGETKKNDIAYLDTESNESFVIRNNTFRNARRFGLLLQSSYGLVERNMFQNLSQCAISMNNGVDWGEGFIAHDIVINQNVFDNCGYDATYFKDYNAAAIRLRVTKLKDPNNGKKWSGVATADWQGLENIVITNNTFRYNKRALSIECTVNTVIKGNQFIMNPNDPSEQSELILKNNNTNLVFDK
ncbi:MAG: right-handed parallel beta-helix repeat-containing protein [Nonlabens sp.]